MDNLIHVLKTVPDFNSVPENQLQWLADHGSVLSFRDGDKVFSSGEVIEGFQIVLNGGVRIFVNQANARRDLGTYEPTEILGRLPYSRMKKAVAEGFAAGETSLLFIHKDHFPDLISQCHDITERLVHNMTDRVRDFTKQQQQNDKMMALGKLSAGLAHELNNPSAAVVRSAQELKRHLSTTPEYFKRVIRIQVSDDIVDQVNHFLFTKINEVKKPLTLLQKTELEDNLADWLSLQGVENPYDLTETFADFAIRLEELDRLKEWLRKEDISPVLRWLNQLLTTEKLVSDIEEASRRINALVTSIKGYTHMDQAPEKHATDIHTGIRNTLTMLGHKIRKNNINVIERFQPDLPMACIFVSEINQVWTNLIDNAVDAMEEIKGGVLEIRTQQDREFINVFIVDNGTGIPSEIQDKVFDPFFTTKPMGKGTGLGLEVVRQIIHQHNGKIDLSSVPGRTEFKICFPIK